MGKQDSAINNLQAGTAARVLIVTDVFPHAAVHECDLWLTQILHTLHELGCELTLVARDDKNRELSEAALRELGVRTYAPDHERLYVFGREILDTSWTLHALLTCTEFDLAILPLNFRWGITVPEHYLDDIRRTSPKTKIAILSGESYAQSGARRAEVTQQLEHYEVAQDWAEREWETLQRADLVLVSHQPHADMLLRRDPSLQVAVVPMTCKEGLQGSDWKARKGVLYAVDLNRPGDVDGFLWFLQQVWTAVTHKSSDIELLIVGGEHIPLESRQKLAQVQWQSINNLEQLLGSARAFVSPTRFGAAKSELMLMAANGIPGVATSAAAECAGFDRESGIATVDSPDAFAAALLRIYQNRNVWKKLTQKCRSFAGRHFSPSRLRSQLEEMLQRAAALAPRPAANQPFSIMLVDAAYSGPLKKAPAKQRITLWLDGHVQIAVQMIRAGNYAGACRQLRHIYSWLGESAKPSLPLARLLSLLARCYRELGEPERLARCATEARRYFSGKAPQPDSATTAPAVHTDRSKLQISLIVPTYNRLSILKKCLAALEAQTVSPKIFEVIVIDDGSSDGTEEAVRQYRPAFQFQYLRQTNSGTGAARKNGVAQARGEYLLLMNDDTICDPDVVEQHLRKQQSVASERWAVLGDFEYLVGARRRALTYFLRTGSFMFPQVDMEDGFPYPYSHFITCNLSIRREAVIQAGSFDSTYKLSEDTELGIRLLEMGYGVLYHPAAHAWHDHIEYSVTNLIRRAKVYGGDYFYMFGRHPRVVREWAMPVDVNGLDERAALRIHNYLEENRRDVEAAVAALANWDGIEFEPILAKPAQAAHVLSLFQQAVPAIHWFYLFHSMLETMTRELHLTHPVFQKHFAAQAAAR